MFFKKFKEFFIYFLHIKYIIIIAPPPIKRISCLIILKKVLTGASRSCFNFADKAEPSLLLIFLVGNTIGCWLISFGGIIYKRVENFYISLFCKIRKPTTITPNITYVNVLSWVVVVSGVVFGKLDDVIAGVFEYDVVVGITIGLGWVIGAVLGNLGGRIVVGPLTIGVLVIIGVDFTGGALFGAGFVTELYIGLFIPGEGLGGILYNITRFYYLFVFFLFGRNAYIPTKTAPIIIYIV